MALPAEPAFGSHALVVVGGSDRWHLLLDRDAAWVAPADGGEAFRLSHADFADHGEVNGTSLVVHRPGGRRPLLLALDAPTTTELQRWMGEKKKLHVGVALHKRLRFSGPIGIFVAVSSLPILGFELDAVGLTFGLGLVALAALGRWRPMAALFGVDALLWLLLSASHLRSALVRSSPWSVAFALVTVWLAVGSFRKLGFYRKVEAASGTR